MIKTMTYDLNFVPKCYLILCLIKMSRHKDTFFVFLSNLVKSDNKKYARWVEDVEGWIEGGRGGWMDGWRNV